MALSDTVSGFPDYKEIIMKAIDEPMRLMNGVSYGSYAVSPKEGI